MCENIKNVINTEKCQVDVLYISLAKGLFIFYQVGKGLN